MKVAALLTAMLLVCVNPLDSVSNAYVHLEPPRITKRKIVTEKIIASIPVKTSAYYGPTKNQNGEYATGSFAGDVRLNGDGTSTKFKKRKPRKGRTIAADPNVFPPGTRLRMFDPMLPVEKRIYYDVEVEDGGGAIKGNRIDIYMGRGKYALRKALKWGTKRMVAQVIEKHEVIILAQK